MSHQGSPLDSKTHLQLNLAKMESFKIPSTSKLLPAFLSSVSGTQRASQVAQWYRICLPMQKTQVVYVQSLGQEYPLEEEMATHSSILA